MRILALDISTHTGWAFSDGSAPTLIFDTVHLGKMKRADGSSQLGLLNRRLMDWLDATITRLKPELVVFESPIVKAQTTMRMLWYLCGAVETVCHDRKLPCLEGAAGKVRNELCGRVPKGTDKKKLVMSYCAEQGWSTKDDNQADALMLLEYARREVGRRG